MKLFKKVIFLFLIFTGIAAACPDADFHGKMERYIQETTSLKKQGKKIVVDSEKIVMETFLAVKGDRDRLEGALAIVMTGLLKYSKNHGYELYIKDPDGNEKGFMEFIGK